MLRGEFILVAQSIREYNGKQYFNLKLRFDQYIYDASTDAQTYMKLAEFQRYTGVFSLFRSRSGSIQLRLDGIE